MSPDSSPEEDSFGAGEEHFGAGDVDFFFCFGTDMGAVEVGAGACGCI